MAKQKGFSDDKLENILTFVFDYMLLPPKLEKEFMLEEPFFQQLKSDEMNHSRGKEAIANVMSFKSLGMTFNEYFKISQAELTAAKEAAKEANIKTIHAMLKANFSIEKIADILDFDINYVKELAALKPIK
jgi:ribosome-interacting GTPase 1